MIAKTMLKDFADTRFVFEFGSPKYFGNLGRFAKTLTGGFGGPWDRVVS